MEKLDSPRYEFKCPKCGGKMFGTSNCHNWDNAVGHCHDFNEDGSRCDFTWNRCEDDKVMVVIAN